MIILGQIWTTLVFLIKNNTARYLATLCHPGFYVTISYHYKNFTTKTWTWYKVASVAVLLTFVMYDSARCPHHTTAGILCICRDGKLIYFILRNFNFLKCHSLGYMYPVQKALNIQHDMQKAHRKCTLHKLIKCWCSKLSSGLYCR
jgi:hypothetical protein